MKKLFLLLILSFFSAQGYAESCPDGSEPKKTVSLDGTYFEYKCADSSTGIDRFGGISEIPEEANPNYETLKFYLYRYLYSHNIYPHCSSNHQYLFCEDKPPYFSHPVESSDNPYQFHFNLREDNYIKQQMRTTPLLSYLLYEDGKIVIDEITPEDRFGDMFRDSSKYKSQSVGKSLVAYVAGHAICKGYIDSVDSRLDDWPILENTLYYNQKLIDILNMAAGTDPYFMESNKFYSSNRYVTSPTVQDIMENELKGSKQSNAQYHYNNLNPILVMSYILYKLGDDDFQQLLDDVFQKKAGIEGDVFFLKNQLAKKDDISIWNQFYATRYDYLRIAKAMLDDWENDTCVGKYLKTIHDRRIGKGAMRVARDDSRVGLPLGYAGFFHTNYKGMESRPVMSMDGHGGQTILIDFERGRIITTQAIHDNMKFPKSGSFDYKKIAYERIKNGKPASNNKAPTELIVDSQEIMKKRNAAIETEKKAKLYWDDYYKKISGVVSFGSLTSNDAEITKVETSASDPSISKVIEVIHGDKLIFNIAEPHKLAGSNINVNLKDIDAPDATKSCPEQMELGIEVRDYVAQKLENASSIKLTNFRKTNTKIIAQVIVDGIDLGDDLVSKGYASKEYGYWKPYFCSPSTAYGLGMRYFVTDSQSSIFWYERAMVLDPESPTKTRATFELYKLYGGVDEVKSIESLKESAALEYIPAMEELGSAYLNGYNVKKDSNQGKKWLKKAFDKGSNVAEGIYCGSLSKEKQKNCKF